ncbi:MAG: hypothetical protein OEZ54_01855 [Gemmatimonadota bacterium]|nr:hypothetical protein [Gemmatimonadota bacterium]
MIVEEVTKTEDPVRRLRHDIANPLAAILAETQLLLLDPDRYDAETLDSLRQIEALSRTMRDILNRSKTP